MRESGILNPSGEKGEISILNSRETAEEIALEFDVLCEKEEVVTAFSGLLELSRRNKVLTNQEELFGDISVEKNNDKIA